MKNQYTRYFRKICICLFLSMGTPAFGEVKHSISEWYAGFPSGQLATNVRSQATGQRLFFEGLIEGSAGVLFRWTTLFILVSGVLAFMFSKSAEKLRNTLIVVLIGTLFLFLAVPFINFIHNAVAVMLPKGAKY